MEGLKERMGAERDSNFSSRPWAHFEKNKKSQVLDSKIICAYIGSLPILLALTYEANYSSNLSVAARVKRQEVDLYHICEVVY